MNPKKISILVLALFVVGSCFSQSFNNARLDSLLSTLDENSKFMGSISVSDGDKILYSGAIGYSDVGNGIKATTDTKYRIGSISKVFTAVLAFKAVEQGKLDLDQTIDAYFPSVQNSEKITVRHLLSHRSGIFNLTNDPSYLAWSFEAKTKEEMIEKVAATESVFEPDSKAEYSNSNYVLLTFILEDVLKKSYGQLAKNFITRPLGLKNTYLGSEIDISNNESYSYKSSKEWVKQPETDMSIPLGAGGIVSTPQDLNKFLQGIFDKKIISKENLQKMITIKDGFGMGIFQFPYYGKELYGHTGGIDGFSSVAVYLPADNVSIAITSNGSNYDNNDILLGALSAYYDKPYKIPAFGTVSLTSEDLDKYLGVYSSLQLPLKITITKNEDMTALMGQATGQGAFQLEATDTHIFAFNQAGIVLEFVPSQKQMTLKQGGGTFAFTKE